MARPDLKGILHNLDFKRPRARCEGFLSDQSEVDEGLEADVVVEVEEAGDDSDFAPSDDAELEEELELFELEPRLSVL
jgi:hypothetical protein